MNVDWSQVALAAATVAGPVLAFVLIIWVERKDQRGE